MAKQHQKSKKKEYSSSVEWKLDINEPNNKRWRGYSRKTKNCLFEIVYNTIFNDTSGYDLFYIANNKGRWFKVYSSLRTAKKGAEAAIKKKIEEGKFWSKQI